MLGTCWKVSAEESLWKGTAGMVFSPLSSVNQEEGPQSVDFDGPGLRGGILCGDRGAGSCSAEDCAGHRGVWVEQVVAAGVGTGHGVTPAPSRGNPWK